MITSQTRVTALVGTINLGLCAYKSGGQTEAEETKYRKGSMQPEESLGGPVSVENVTVRKLFDPEMRGLYHQLHALVGKAPMTVTVQPLDADGLPQGRAQVYQGVFNRITPPEANANANDPAEIEFECSTHGSIA